MGPPPLGIAYPDVTWEPNQSFRAVASFYAGPAVLARYGKAAQ